MTNKEINALKWNFVWYGSAVADTPRGGRIFCNREEIFYVGEDHKQCEKAEEIITKHNSDLENLRDKPKEHYCTGTGCCPR